MIGVGGLRIFVPVMHIHHCASYEVSAIKRLNGRHAGREAEVDELLRNLVFIDLSHRRPVDRLLRQLDEIGQSSDWLCSAILKKICDYNWHDCPSRVQLIDWLHERQEEHGDPTYCLRTIPRPLEEEELPADA